MKKQANKKKTNPILGILAVIILILLSVWLELPDTEEVIPPLPEGAGIAVHFIDVGQADAALVVCDDETMLIDGGNAEDSNLIYTYLEKHGVSHLDYVVCTHAHEDHVGGLPGALEYATVDTALCPVTAYDTKAFTNFVNALRKRGADITVPEVGDRFALGSAQVTVLSCDSENDDTNATSIVLRIVHGETSFLFTGDAEYGTEKEILETGLPVKSTVLKVGHHGSETSSCSSFLWEADPQYAVVSVGKDNTYGHPSDDVMSRLEDMGAVIYRTDTMGDIVCVGDGKTLTFTTDRNAPVA